MRSERSIAWIAAANRNGTVSSAATAAIRQYEEENHSAPRLGLVDPPIAVTVTFSAN